MLHCTCHIHIVYMAHTYHKHTTYVHPPLTHMPLAHKHTTHTLQACVQSLHHFHSRFHQLQILWHRTSPWVPHSPVYNIKMGILLLKASRGLIYLMSQGWCLYMSHIQWSWVLVGKSPSNEIYYWGSKETKHQGKKRGEIGHGDVGGEKGQLLPNSFLRVAEALGLLLAPTALTPFFTVPSVLWGPEQAGEANAIFSPLERSLLMNKWSLASIGCFLCIKHCGKGYTCVFTFHPLKTLRNKYDSPF